MNLVWYKHWYNDKIRQLTIQQDLNFERLIYFYLYFGFRYPSNIFKHIFWYDFSFCPQFERKLFNLKYERQFEFFDKFLNENVQVTLRNRTKDFFASKMWMMRYHNWIIINFYTFQPVKKKKIKKHSYRFNFSSISTGFSNENILHYKRIKLLHLYLNFLSNTYYYKF